MDKVFAAILGVIIFCAVIVSVATSEDETIAEKCDYAGKVKLADHIYECRRAQQPTQPAEGE